MTSYKNFQSRNQKHSTLTGRGNDADFTPTVGALGDKESISFQTNLKKYMDFASWLIWYPDLFLDLIKPQEGGINLHADQRFFLRAICRFFSIYGVFPRGWGKTHGEVLAMFIICIRYPSIEVALTAQTKQNAAELLKDKYYEIIKQYPLLKNEIFGTPKFSKDDAEINFTNGSRIDILANSNSSKGQRRKRIHLEEAALLDNDTFMDALSPIVEVPRYTVGKLGVVNPEELSGSIHFFTTSGFRGSTEFDRNMQMLDNMINLKGEMVLGANWMLGCWYGRGSTKSQIIEKKKKMSPISFAQNHESKWVGSTDGSLVSINKLLKCRTLLNAKFKSDTKRDYFLGVDVARSQNTSNNQSSVVVAEVVKSKKGRIISINIVNVFTISNVLNFTAQAAKVKKIKRSFNAKMVVVDGNGLGAGLVDALMKETFDPITNESLGCWNTINTDAEPETTDAENCMFDLKSTSVQSDIIVTFIDMVDSGKLRLLQKKQDADYDVNDKENYITNMLPFIHTDFLIEEIANLQLKHMKNGKLSVEKVVSRYDKDRFSALSYVLWYIKEFESSVVLEEEEDDLAILTKYTVI